MFRYLKNKLKSIFCLHEWELENKSYEFFAHFKCKKCGSEMNIKRCKNGSKIHD